VIARIYAGKSTTVVLLLILFTACSSPPKQSKAPEQSWHWEWASTNVGGTSEQFARDKYTCLQDYRQTASPYTQRDPITEMKFMTMHQEVCLESKGWKRVADSDDRSLYFWTPNGWFKATTDNKPVWRWKGEAGTNAQHKQDSDECIKEARMVNSRAASRAEMEVWFACMWKRDWRREPVRQESAVQSAAKLYWRPNGWITAPPGTKKIDWVWEGAASEERAALKRFESDKSSCSQEVGMSDPRDSTTQQGDAFMACMWEKKWGTEPFK
jgi:hypothetical protein